ncbi:RING finger protein 145-like isoform X2 [Rana temporaria]|uniref:RING finger protein 145-like isoform X2 n=1 Tax=Rana temporaria TaxID=8407 RepID=UPI001AADED0D|nr:RING finger protein 145-like isoform X2 [Rana temporaria]
MPSLEDVANVALRVPAVVLLDLLYRWDVEEFSAPSYSTSTLQSYLLCHLYYLAHVMCAVLVALPLRHLLNIYLYLLSSLLLYVTHQTVRDYVRQEMEVGYSGTVYKDQTSLTRSVSTLTGLVMVCTLCSLLMRTRRAWLFSAPVLPLLARLAGLPLRSLPLLNAVSTGATLLVMCYVALSGFRPLCRLFTKAYQDLTQEMELYRLVALGMALWTHLAVPAIFLVFWVVLYLLHIYSALSSKPGILEQQGAIFILLNSVSECCGTPYCLLGLTSTVSYLALGMLNLCKFYLMGYAAFQNGNAMHRGVTEGVTLMLLSLQTGLLEMQVLQRTFLLSIILFIVITSTLQSMIEIADPIVLALAATGNRSVWKHERGLSLCLFLLVFPTFMAYKIAFFFHMDFWLLILVSSCLLTSLQVLGTLFIYALFMMELFLDSRVERMDEIIYGVNAISRVLEFLVALCVVAYGTWESIFGEWSWMGVSVIIVHSYFNVWLRAQSGWKSFLLRREAAKKISHLPRATEEELRAHNDVCSICFQEMSIAVITICGHYFHADCLKKWLYVQDTCPLCHQLVRAIAKDDKEEEFEEPDFDERGAGGRGGIHMGEGGIGLQGEHLEEPQAANYGVERGTFVGENGHGIEETTGRSHLEIQQEKENVPYRKVEGVLLEERKDILYWWLEEDHYREEQEEEVLCMEKQEDEVLCVEKQEDEVLYRGQDKEEASWSQGDVLHREEQKKGHTCRKEQIKENFLSSEKEKTIFREHQEVVLSRKAVQVLLRKEGVVDYREEHKDEVPCREETKVLCKEDQDVVPFRKTGQVVYSGLEGVPCRQMQKEKVPGGKEVEPCRNAVQVLYRKLEEVPCREMQKEEVPGGKENAFYSEEEEVEPCRKEVKVLLRDKGVVHYREEQKDEFPCREETKVLCKEDREGVPLRKAAQVLYSDLEDVPCREMQKEEVPGGKKKVFYSEEEEVEPCRKEVQVLLRDKGVVHYREEQKDEFPCREETKVLCKEDREGVPLRKAAQVLNSDLEDVPCREMQKEEVSGGKKVFYSEGEEVEPYRNAV